MGMMHKQHSTFDEGTIQNIEHLLHGTTVILIAAVNLAEGINDDELRTNMLHNLLKIRDILSHLEDIQ